jgi:hypothetical protein
MFRHHRQAPRPFTERGAPTRLLPNAATKRRLRRSSWCVALLAAALGCESKSTAEASTAQRAEAAASTTAEALPADPPANSGSVTMADNIDPRCPKFRDDVGKQLGAEVTEIDFWEPINNGPMRCIFKTADANRYAAIEIGGPGGELAAARKGFEQGGKPSDSPLGSHVFRADFGGLRHVIGNKGSTRIMILGTGQYPPLETLWEKVASNE